MADLDQSVRRGDDTVRRRLRRALPDPPPRPALVLLLAAPVPQHDGHLAAVPQPARLGHLRRQHLPNGLAALLVPRARPGSGLITRPCKAPPDADHLRHPRARLAGRRPPLAAVRADLLPAGRPGNAPRRLG